MNLGPGYIDVLFILLFATIAMLVDTVPLAGLDAEPGRVGADAGAAVEPTVVVVAVGEALRFGEASFDDEVALRGALPADAEVVLVAQSPGVSHQRVLDVWSSLRVAGVDVRLGAARGEAPGDATGGG